MLDDSQTSVPMYTIEVILSCVHEAYGPIVDKIKELELLEQTEVVKDLIVVAKLRLDTLAKVEKNLLDKLKEIYVLLESGEAQPGDLPAARKEMQKLFIDSLLQGLK